MIHFVGLPSASHHCERSLPSKRTTASPGGWPAFSGVLAVAGVTMVGHGRARSWSIQLGSGAAKVCARTRRVVSKAMEGIDDVVFMNCVATLIAEVSGQPKWILAVGS